MPYNKYSLVSSYSFSAKTTIHVQKLIDFVIGRIGACLFDLGCLLLRHALQASVSIPPASVAPASSSTAVIGASGGMYSPERKEEKGGERMEGRVGNLHSILGELLPGHGDGKAPTTQKEWWHKDDQLASLSKRLSQAGHHAFQFKAASEPQIQKVREEDYLQLAGEALAAFRFGLQYNPSKFDVCYRYFLSTLLLPSLFFIFSLPLLLTSFFSFRIFFFSPYLSFISPLSIINPFFIGSIVLIFLKFLPRNVDDCKT